MVRSVEERVLIVAPEGRNASVLATILSKEGVHTTICEDGFTLAGAIAEGAGVVLLTDHFLHHGNQGPLEEMLKHQPPWSDLPLIVLAWPERAESALATLVEVGRDVQVVERPASISTLVSSVESALRARRRQYEIRRLLGELQDLSEELEARVEERTQKVYEMATALAQAEAQERERIAQILHDNLQQILVAATIQLQLASQMPELDPELRATLTEAEEMMDEAVDIARNLSVDLSPPVLKNGGLAAALRWLEADMESNYRLEVELKVDLPVDQLDEEVSTLLFRATRELLFNVVKHAGARQAEVKLGGDEGELVLSVADRGRGFDPQGVAEQASGYGLSRIRERASLYGGRVNVETGPGEGTTVKVILPL